MIKQVGDYSLHYGDFKARHVTKTERMSVEEVIISIRGQNVATWDPISGLMPVSSDSPDVPLDLALQAMAVWGTR